MRKGKTNPPIPAPALCRGHGQYDVMGRDMSTYNMIPLASPLRRTNQSFRKIKTGEYNQEAFFDNFVS